MLFPVAAEGLTATSQRVGQGQDQRAVVDRRGSGCLLTLTLCEHEQMTPFVGYVSSSSVKWGLSALGSLSFLAAPRQRQVIL